MDVQEIWKQTQSEIQEGIASELWTREEMDETFGPGNWRPLIRHVIWQAGKWRPIDDGKRSRTNALARVKETVVCIPPEFLIILLRYLAISFIKRTGSLPRWFQPRVSLDDWWKGFRQLFPTMTHMGLATVAVMCPIKRRWYYTVLRGLPFGVGVAVNQ